MNKFKVMKNSLNTLINYMNSDKFYNTVKKFYQIIYMVETTNKFKMKKTETKI